MVMRVKKILLLFYVLLFTLTPLVSVYPAVNPAKFESAKGYFRKGVVYFNNMQYLAAADFFRKAVQEYPDYYTARDYLARSYKLSGFKESALNELNKTLEIYPDNIAIKNRIESLHFRNAYSGSDGNETYLMQSEYKSAHMKTFSFPDAADMAVDGERNLYITSFSTSKVVRIDPNGNGEEIIRPGFGGGLYGIDFSNKTFAVSDFKSDMIYIFSEKGKILKKFGGTGNAEGLFHGPKGVCFDGKGFIYAVDGGNYRVQKFDTSGRFVLSFGKMGDYESELANPTDIAVLGENVYVTDTSNKKIVVFDHYGNYVNEIFMDELLSPRGISAKGNSLVISDEKSGIIIYDTLNGSKTVFSSWESDRKLNRPLSAIFDQDGFFYVLESRPNSIFCFSPAEKQYSNLELEITSVDAGSFPVVAYYVNVKGRDGRPVYGLRPENFSITEDNSEIINFQIDYLKRRATSASFVMAVDRSPEMTGYHKDLPWLAEFILKVMRKNDSIELLNFNEQVWAGNNFDWSRRRTLSAIEKMEYKNGKQTGAALYQALTDLIPRPDRRGVVLVTDGTVAGDSFTQYSPDTIISYANEHYIPIYIISMKNPDSEIIRIAMETGGKVIRPSEIDSLRKIYSDVKTSEEYRYVLVYNTYKLPSFTGWWVDVKLEVKYKGQIGHEWGGYFVP
jgi:DNA-binding beta-propeller fold protein YncE